MFSLPSIGAGRAKGLPMTREMQIAVERAVQAAGSDPLVEALEALQAALDDIDDWRGWACEILAKYAPDKEGGAE